MGDQTPTDPGARTALVREAALELGFDAVGVAPASEPWRAGAGLAHALSLGRHGDMEWLMDAFARRAHPTSLWPQARSAVVVGLNYGPAHDPLSALACPETAAISVYAHGGDYHDVLKRRLKALAGALVTRCGGAVKVFVDTAPLMEKPLAARAGLGWQGKHTNLVSREHGSWLFLGVLLTDLDLQADAAEPDRCGSCRACLDVCPTDAFPAPYRLDASRCLAYLTIEHQGPIPREMRAAMANRVYGCDDCLAVCPWNKFAQATREAALTPRPEARGAELVALCRLSDADFRAVFAGSPIKRTGRARFVRNCLIALGNSGRSDVAGVAVERLCDESALVRGAAVWAAWRLMDGESFAGLLAVHRARESDPEVLAEWDLCLASSASEGTPA